MRDVHLCSGPKQKVANIETARLLVRAVYPTATNQGSMCAWSWVVGDRVVAEAWMHADSRNWWLRIDHPQRPEAAT